MGSGINSHYGDTPTSLYLCVHVCTIVYMNIRDFRMNLKDCFNSALAGERVEIERGGVTYRLVADLGSPRTSDEQVTIMPPIFKKSNTFRLDNGSCKIHGMPLTVYGKCLVKGCKNG